MPPRRVAHVRPIPENAGGVYQLRQKDKTWGRSLLCLVRTSWCLATCATLPLTMGGDVVTRAYLYGRSDFLREKSRAARRLSQETLDRLGRSLQTSVRIAAVHRERSITHKLLAGRLRQVSAVPSSAAALALEGIAMAPTRRWRRGSWSWQFRWARGRLFIRMPNASWFGTQSGRALGRRRSPRHAIRSCPQPRVCTTADALAGWNRMWHDWRETIPRALQTSNSALQVSAKSLALSWERIASTMSRLKRDQDLLRRSERSIGPPAAGSSA